MPKTAGKYPGALTRSAAFALLVATVASSAQAGVLDEIGVSELRLHNPGLTGAGVTVAQVESTDYSGPPQYDPDFDADNYQFDPTLVFTGTAPNLTFLGKEGTTPSSTYNPSQVSDHATAVAQIFFGTAAGVAPAVSTVYSYNVNFYANNAVFADSPLAGGIPVAPQVINQSVVFDKPTASDDAIIAQIYDNYVVHQKAIIVSAAGNGPNPNPIFDMPMVQSPANAYNVISVGALGINPGSTGTLDGRSKPDITAPGWASSFTTPLVAGVATLMVQAGTSINSAAVDPRTVKALLLNGAVKSVGWTHSQSAPLDPQTGAGIVNAINSYRNLMGGEQFPTTTTFTNSLGAAHPAINSGNLVSSQGWTLNTIQNLPNNHNDVVQHYLITIPNGGALTTSVTLTWNRPFKDVLTNYPNTPASGINNLDLYLYNASTGATISASTSLIDNVEHLFIPRLATGQYDLQVVKNGGGSSNSNWVSSLETYALAWMTNIPGDANLDGKVDAFDLNTLAVNWQGTGKLWTTGDFNGDGKVDAFDLNDIASNWQRGSSSALTGELFASIDGSSLVASGGGGLSIGSSSVPEPASLMLLAFGSTMLLTRARRRN